MTLEKKEALGRMNIVNLMKENINQSFKYVNFLLTISLATLNKANKIRNKITKHFNMTEKREKGRKRSS